MDKIRHLINALILTIVGCFAVLVVIGTIMFCVNIMAKNSVNAPQIVSFIIAFTLAFGLAWYCIKKD